MEQEVIKEEKKKLPVEDLKVIKGWISAAIAIILVTTIIVGCVHLKANSVALENDFWTKEEAEGYARSYLEDRSSAYRDQVYEVKTKTDLIYTVGKMDEAYHIYYVNFKSETIDATIKVDALNKTKSIYKTNVN